MQLDLSKRHHTLYVVLDTLPFGVFNKIRSNKRRKPNISGIRIVAGVLKTGKLILQLATSIHILMSADIFNVVVTQFSDLNVNSIHLWNFEDTLNGSECRSGEV